MDSSNDLPERITLSQSQAQAHVARLTDSDDRTEALKALELLAVDIYSLFEARLQHHFKRGPFARKLKALLLEHGKDDLARSVHQYYLAVNVLKHGKGASYRKLQNTSDSFIALHPRPEIDENDEAPLIDVTAAGFMDDLCDTLHSAYAFLEKP